MSILKIGIQKKGRLQEDSMKLLKDCGIAIDNGRDQLKAVATNFPLEIYFLRNSDIPEYVADGVIDLAIIGQNTLIEKQNELPVVRELGFSKCRVSLAVPKDTSVEGLNYFEGKQIATSYPKTLQSFLEQNKINASIHEIAGSVEIAPNMGLADAVMDIVSSGNTLFKNGLKETNVVLKSQAVLVKSNTLNKEKEALIKKLDFRIKAVLKGKASKYVLMNVPNSIIPEIGKILPVLKSPTILPLAKKGWSSLHSVINKEDFWEVIDKLKEQGAEDILVVPIEKLVR